MSRKKSTKNRLKKQAMCLEEEGGIKFENKVISFGPKKPIASRRQALTNKFF